MSLSNNLSAGGVDAANAPFSLTPDRPLGGGAEGDDIAFNDRAGSGQHTGSPAGSPGGAGGGGGTTSGSGSGTIAARA